MGKTLLETIFAEVGVLLLQESNWMKKQIPSVLRYLMREFETDTIKIANFV